MAIDKINGFKAPYRSSTFQKQANSLVQQNGVVTMDGQVSESGGDITVPPFSFIQNGLIVKKDNIQIISAPSTPSPFYLTVTAATPANLDDLSFQFSKSPDDISDNEVVIAEYDGEEWRTLPFLSIKGIYDDVKTSYADFDLIGPFSGLITSYNSPNFENSPGVIVDKTGARKKLTETVLFPEIGNDPEATWGRVDRVLYRRPIDDPKRIGVRKLITGGTYDSGGPSKKPDVEIFTNATGPKNVVKSLIDSNNEAIVLSSVGYGTSFGVNFKKYNDSRASQIVSEFSLTESLTVPVFDAVIDDDDNFHIIYINGENLEYQGFDSIGTTIGPAVVLDNSAKLKDNPKITIDPDNNNLFVVYEREEGISNLQIQFIKLTLLGSLVTGPVNLTGSISNLKNPSISVNNDLWVYVAWDEPSLGKVFYQDFDDIGVPLNGSTPILVSGATDQIGGGTLVDAANSPQIIATDSKQLVIAFLQDRGGSNFGISIWQDGSVHMPIISGNFGMFSLHVDSIGTLSHLLLGSGSQIDYVRIKDQAVDFSIPVVATTYQSLHMVFDKTGSMLHMWSDEAATTFTSYDSGVTVDTVGPTTKTGGTITPSVPVSSEQILVLVSSKPVAPKTGEKIIITSLSPPNGAEGTYLITNVELLSVNTTNDTYRITVDSSLGVIGQNPAVGLLSEYFKPDGNSVHFAKSTSELEAYAFSFDELDSDILLSRIVMPGEIILNYIAGGSGPALNSDLLTPFGAATLDWESTTSGELTIVGDLKIIDLVNNFTYALAAGGYAMTEDDALYVVLNGVDNSPTPLVTSIATLPFGTPIQVLGLIKNNQFVPHLMGVSGMGAIESGEIVRVDNDLPQPIRTRLGITSDVAVEPYTSSIGANTSDSYPTIISQTNIMAGQNKHVKFVKARISWEETAANTLSIHREGFFTIPGVAESRNRIAPQNVVIDADDKVAYVDINRTAGASADLSISVAKLDSFTISRNTIVLARRIKGTIVVEQNGLVIPSGHKVDVDDPFPIPLKLKEHATDSTLVVVQTSEIIKQNSDSLNMTMYRSLMAFDGAIINTVSGEVFEKDGTTPLGDDYVVPTIAAEQFRWFSVSLGADATSSDNKVTIKLKIGIGASDGATSSAAAKANFTGDLFVGQYFLQRNVGDTAFEAITDANFINVDIPSGVGGLQTQIDTLISELNTIKSNNPKHQLFTGDGIADIFTLTEFTVDPDNAVEDSELYISGKRQNIASSGIFTANRTWKKLTDTTFQLDVVPEDGQEFTVYKQGTAVIVSTGGGGSTDLTNIAVDIQPDTSANRSVGTVLKPWKDIFLKDKNNSNVYRLEIVNGVFQGVLVP